MAKVYQWRFHVRSYDVAANGQVGTATYLRFCEEGATQASADAGYDYYWYRERGQMWVVRKITMRFFAPAQHGEDIELQTWVSDFKRVQSNREYDLRRIEVDGSLTPLVRARANWAYLNAETMMPERVPAEFLTNFDPAGSLDPLDVSIPDPLAVEAATVHVSERRVQRYELDSNGHVNNTVYVQWAEQAVIDALRAAGWPPEQLEGTLEQSFGASGVRMQPYAAEIDYFRSALDNDAIKITTQLVQISNDQAAGYAAWRVEIRYAESDDLIVVATLVKTFVDSHGPCPIPNALQLALIQRQRSERG
jgi:medium-chain acyl-[acyl-carrier-protein] hydrolase